MKPNGSIRILTKTCQTFSLAPSKEQNRMLTPARNREVITVYNLRQESILGQ